MACNAACESQGILGEIRTCSDPLHGGEECTRDDQTKTTSGNRVELRETTCENILPCPSKKHNFVMRANYTSFFSFAVDKIKLNTTTVQYRKIKRIFFASLVTGNVMPNSRNGNV